LRLGVPSIVLIWSPDGYLALVDEGDSETLGNQKAQQLTKGED